MELEKIKEECQANESRYELAENLRKTIQQSDKALQPIIKEKTEQYKQKYSNIIEQIKQSALKPLKDQMAKHFDTLLIQLISKRQEFKLDNGTKCAISYAGISCEYHRPYWRDREGKYSYLPTNYHGKFQNYIMVLSEWQKIYNLLHKQDKKELISLAGTFAVKYNKIENFSLPEGKKYKVNTEYVEWVAKNAYWRSEREYSIQHQQFDKISVAYTVDGINFTLHGLDKEATLYFKANMGIEDIMLLHELMQIEEVKEIILYAINKYEKATKQFKQIKEEFEEAVRPYAVMEML